MTMQISDLKDARDLLARNCAKVDPFAVEYLDYDAFEGVLEAVMASGEATQEMIMQVFSASIRKAQMLRARDRTVGPTN